MANKKFSPMRYTASSEEAALTGALQIVGVARDEIEYEVLEQSAKGITVRIRPRSDEAATAPLLAAAPGAETPVTGTAELATPQETALEEASPIAEDVPELLAQSDEETADSSPTDLPPTDADSEIEAQLGEELDALAADFADETPDFGAGSEGELEQAETVSTVATETETVPEIVAPDLEVVTRAQQKAQEILDKMGLDAQVQVESARESHVVSLVVEGEDVGILIGKHGATLQSFQYLLNLMLNAHLEGEEARAGGARVVIDAGNYRARRAAALEQIARGAASKVRRDGRLVRLEPMPAHERRLVHLFLQTEADIVTQSEGREPMRRIVVSPPTVGAISSPIKSESSRPERSASEGRSGFGSFRRGDAQSERNRGLQNRR